MTAPAMSTTEPRTESGVVSGARMLPMVTEILDGPVAPVDRVYAFDVMHELCERAPLVVNRARAHLRMRTNPKGRDTVLAEISLVIDGGVLVFGAEKGRSVREVVDRLGARLRHDLQRVSLRSQAR